MRALLRFLFSYVLLVLLSVLSVLQVDALTITYCSTDNTGAVNAAVLNDYQSNGACQTTCQFQYAFAIVQDKQCWCSNYAPADTVDNGQCNEQCPGFPFENCGSLSAGLFGYVALSISPSGTIGAAATTSIASPTFATTPTLAPTVNDPPTTITSATLNVPTTTSTWSPVPYASVTTITGKLETVIITPTAPKATETVTTVVSTPSSGSSLGAGQIAGIAVGIGLAIIFLVFFLLWFHRHRLSHQDHHEIAPDMVSTAPITHSRESRHLSRALSTNDRLNPNAFTTEHSNGSQVTIQDNVDYSRPVLQITNP